MKKALLCLSLFVINIICCLGKQDELVVLTSADNPPYEYMRHGDIVGFDIDLAKEIATKLNRKLIIKDMPFSFIVPALMSKQGDMAISAITPTDARRENVDFSISYQDNISAIVLANKEEFANMLGTDAVFPIELLEGKTVGVQLGTHHETDIRAANIPDLTIKRYDNIGSMIAEISKSAAGNGTVYGLIIGFPEARKLVEKNPKLCVFHLKFSDSFAVAFTKNSPLRENVNRILVVLKENGRLDELEAKWDIK